jgi:hypothetical protein
MSPEHQDFYPFDPDIMQKKANRATYNAERDKSAGPDDIFMLYTETETSDDYALPDRSGLVDPSCWDSCFGPFSSRAYMALSSRYKLETLHMMGLPNHYLQPFDLGIIIGLYQHPVGLSEVILWHLSKIDNMCVLLAERGRRFSIL